MEYSDDPKHGNYKVIKKRQKILRNLDHAEDVLKQIAIDANLGNYSKTIVIGRFYTIAKHARQKHVQMVKRFLKQTRQCARAPIGKIIQIENNMAICHNCNSTFNLEYFSATKANVHGVCIVCAVDDKKEVVSEDVFFEAVGSRVSGFDEDYISVTGTDLTIKRTLYSQEYEKANKRLERKYHTKIKNFSKKRKRFLQIKGNLTPAFLVLVRTTT